MYTHPPRSLRADVIALVALCAVTFFVGLTTHGLTNWQEAQRALVAREMHHANEWIVPTVDGRPYLAKPPVIYWMQLAIASVLAREPGEFELRLTVALGGLAGVLATYVVARWLFSADDAAAAPHIAFWSACFLATGLLYARSSRIGELDILLAWPCVLAIGASWRATLGSAWVVRVAWLVLAAACCIVAALTKGPPALVVIAAGVPGAALTVAAWSGPRSPRVDRLAGLLAINAFVGMAISSLVLNPPLSKAGVGAFAGAAVFGLLAAGAAATLTRLASPARFRAACASLWRTQAWLTLAAGVGSLWLWGRAVAGRVGEEAVRGAVRAEAGDNLRILELASPLKNIEAASFGVGLGSIAAIIAVVWLIRERPRLTPGLLVIIAWCALGLGAMSLLGKGVGRYLTPIWPAIAMLGAVWFVQATRRAPRWRLVVGLAVTLLGVGQGAWYSFGREALLAERSPRSLLGELLSPGAAVDPSRLAMFEFDTPAVDFYAGRSIPSVLDVDPRPGVAGVGPWTLADLRDRLDDGDWTLLVRQTQPRGMDSQTPIDRLTRLGFACQTIPTAAAFKIDNARTRVIAVRVWRVTPPNGPPGLSAPLR